MKIGITADPEISVPPVLYGGIERIIYMLIIELMKAGHEVILFAHKESKVPCELVAYSGIGNNLSDIIKNSFLIVKTVIKKKIDVIHSFGRLAYLTPLMPFKLPILMSYQREPTLSQIKKAIMISRKGTIAFTGCSDYISNKIKPIARTSTVYNCVNLDDYLATEIMPDDAPLVFLGRIEPIKGAHTAIEVALKINKKLIIAGNIPDYAQIYYEQEIKPHLGSKIEYIGTVNDQQKNELLGKASALLMLIHWDEPFGIVMIEAMACGTPVVGFKKGAIPEVVINGLSGYLVNDKVDAEKKVSFLHLLSRAAVRNYVENKFSPSIVANQYIILYDSFN
jgi:glycosyltransferase involved in cell wall biosynthesis